MIRAVKVNFSIVFLFSRILFWLFSIFFNKDPSGCSLIVQFLYHANMTEQVYNANTNSITISASINQAQNPNQLKPAGDIPGNSNESGLALTTTNSLTSNVPVINQNELKMNRIQMLRILAIKTAAILDWNLIIFEKE